MTLAFLAESVRTNHWKLDQTSSQTPFLPLPRLLTTLFLHPFFTNPLRPAQQEMKVFRFKLAYL